MARFYDKLVARDHTQTQNELDQQLSRQRQTIQVSLAALRSLSRATLDGSIPDGELHTRLFVEVPHKELSQSATVPPAIPHFIEGSRRNGAVSPSQFFALK